MLRQFFLPMFREKSFPCFPWVQFFSKGSIKVLQPFFADTAM
ncbi:hypothetical protein APHNP_0545 [Anaplasma phagocytophilum str. ApNP]|uniref:Uncharacterized protein n=1 Tax=Anaplasma phagocytophilum str. ApNP TaxID=1359153 RepID=A0A0F3NHN8_ANAPH|nr:hypothetical protein APHNP_0545 [Anaplasma phagocytophilum str. ApNP]